MLRVLRKALGRGLALDFFMREHFGKSFLLRKSLSQRRRQRVATPILQRNQIPNGVSVARVVHVHEGAVAIAKHTKLHLWTTFPVRSAELKEGVAHEVRISWRLSQLDCFRQIFLHVPMHAVILTDENRHFQCWGPETALRVFLEDHISHLSGSVRSVEAVHKARSKRLDQVISGLVVDWFFLRAPLQTSPKLFHLSQRRSIGMHICIWEQSK
mmetsp:Transcript_20653/g.38785  ORF Transcript_20653/g.38785 Transcript_20653/m.38785 type:complete len:213 (-) Transcript_20653:100-738(-)